MYRIALEFVPSWEAKGNDKWPTSVDVICPHCGRQVNFQLQNWNICGKNYSRFSLSRCSGCSNKSSFYWLADPSNRDGKDDLSFELYIHPTPKLIRQPISGIDEIDEFTEALGQAYSAAINAYNVRQWIAAAVLCGRVLEGLAKALMPDDKKDMMLGALLKELPNHVDFDTSIMALADGIRKGRNIGAHFDDKQPDEETAEMMMDLIDYIIEFLFVLPKRIERLHAKLEE